MEQLRTSSLYEDTPAKVVDYDEARLNVLKASFVPKDISGLAPPEVERAFRAPDR